MRFVSESLLLNVVLNIIFIPKLGIVASAYATVVSYFWLSLRYYLSSCKIIDVSFNLRNFILGGIIGLIIAALDFIIPVIDSFFVSLIIRLLLGGGIAIISILIFQPEARMISTNLYLKIRDRLSKEGQG